MDSLNKFCTKGALARRYNVSVRTISNWISRGVIPHIKIKRTVLLEVAKCDQALGRFERHGIKTPLQGTQSSSEGGVS